ncbi:uncharacterized protein [Ptychodera flava]|uniref:uncharacterized protein n=1 Tax=Ptychodera flava TaxID=63121 RepID=UPI003969BC9E
MNLQLGHRRGIPTAGFLSVFIITCLLIRQGLASGHCPECNGYICKCVSVIHNRTVSSEATLQNCDNPIAITFMIEVTSFKVNMLHTFSNEDETLEVDRWDGFRLHVKLMMISPSKVKVMANFKIFEKEQAVILDRSFDINRHDCSVLQFGGMSDGGKIGIAIVVLVLVIAVIIALIVLYQRNYICAKKPPLVEMMEGPASSEPYQEGPSEATLRVEYKANKASVKSEGKDEIITNANAQSTEALNTAISRPRPKSTKVAGSGSASAPSVAILEPSTSSSKTTGAIPKVRSAQTSSSS